MNAAVIDAFDFSLPARPYPGLRPFMKDEWPIFFGREGMTDEVIARLMHNRLLVVHGDSGCGKSSLIRAGVQPRLEQQFARGGDVWRGTSNPQDLTAQVRRYSNCESRLGRDGVH